MPFSPSSIPGLNLWLKADVGTLQTSGGSAASADGDPVGQWLDQSGNGNDVSQTTSGARPALRLAVQNGLPVVRFDGVNDSMRTAGSVPAGTVFAVVNHADGATFTDFRRVLDGQDAIGWSTFGLPTSSRYNADDQFDRNVSPTEYWVNGVQTTAAAPLSAFRVMSALIKVPTTTTLAGLGTYHDGSGNPGGQWLYGDIGEVLIYGSRLSTSDRQAVEAYLTGRWLVAPAGGGLLLARRRALCG